MRATHGPRPTLEHATVIATPFAQLRSVSPEHVSGPVQRPADVRSAHAMTASLGGTGSDVSHGAPMREQSNETFFPPTQLVATLPSQTTSCPPLHAGAPAIGAQAAVVLLATHVPEPMPAQSRPRSRPAVVHSTAKVPLHVGGLAHAFPSWPAHDARDSSIRTHDLPSSAHGSRPVARPRCGFAHSTRNAPAHAVKLPDGTGAHSGGGRPS